MNIVTSIGVGTWVFHPPCHACGAPFVASGAWIASHAAFLAGSQRAVGRPAMACAVADGAYLMPRAIVIGMSVAFGIWTAGIGWSSMVAWMGLKQRANAPGTCM
ncbi:hypothetical protein [Paraburkholderia sp. BR14320]|uniref:hypothetical protein n=1 Tax=unclassified Paraburkholderia TaxID=2615204 RepID=UPI0034CEB85F